ncbi:MAG: hypothetical protein FWG72_10425 [Oscillospiraceae bacterium]|nr:hypothetical protein [Oscillospiraceae bacterium]
MRKLSENNIVWCEPTNNRRKPHATMSADGTLCFGVNMRDRLPQKIRIGLLPNECSLCVEANAEKGFALAKNGTVKVFDIVKQLKQLGIDLPAHFLFAEERENSLWKGYIVPPPRKPRPQAAKKATPLTGHSHLLPAYKWLLDKAVYLYAKTTPIDERRATAQAALWEALHTYTSIQGQLKDYLFEEIKRQLIEKNKQYTRHSSYNVISLDASICNDTDSDMTGHGRFFSRYTNDMLSVERKIDMEIFRYQWLNFHERTVLNMLLEGYTVEEIQDEHHMTEQALGELCRSIGSRWEAFSRADCAM